jgi:hypothetical protein
MKRTAAGTKQGRNTKRSSPKLAQAKRRLQEAVDLVKQRKAEARALRKLHKQAKKDVKAARKEVDALARADKQARKAAKKAATPKASRHTRRKVVQEPADAAVVSVPGV